MQHPDPELWQAFFSAFGTSAAALVGLLFVVASLHLDKLTKDPLLEHRAKNVSLLMMLLFLQSLAVLVPQDHMLLGAEICALNLVMVYFPASSAWMLHEHNLPIPINRIGTGILCALAGAIGGILLTMNWAWSLHVIAGANAVAIFVLVANAWSLMLGLWRTKLLKSSNTKVR